LTFVSFTGTENFKENLTKVDDGTRAAVISIALRKHVDDLRTLDNEHGQLLQLINDWKGDLQKELDQVVSEVDTAKRILSSFQRLDEIEGKIRPFFDESKRIEADERKKLSDWNPAKIDGATRDDLLKELDALAQPLKNWAVLAKQAWEIIEETDKYVTVHYQARSEELQNYQYLKDHVDEIVQGTGSKYGGKSVEERRKILYRYLRAKDSKPRRAIEAHGNFELSSIDLEKVKAFLKGADEVFADIQVTKDDNHDRGWTYGDSLKSLSEKGYTRHLYPWEAFDILFATNENPIGKLTQIKADMLHGWGEWLNIAFMKKGDTLYVVKDPVGFNGDEQPQGKLEEYKGFSKIPTLNFVSVSKLVDEHGNALPFVTEMWHQDINVLTQKNAGIWLAREGEWRPVARGDYDDNSFYLYAVNYRGASRGVRRK
jgi:hypothetical protein